MADDLSRWLRAVRPPTSADDEWTRTQSADEILAAVHRRTAPRPTIHPGRWRRRLISVSLPAAATVIGLVIATVRPESSRPAPGSDLALPAVRPAAMLLDSFASCDDLLDGLRTHASTHVASYGFPGSYEYGYNGPFVMQNASSAPASSGAGANYAGAPVTSTTNVQEQGVDEPDIVKPDGNRIVTLTDGVLRVVDVVHKDIAGSLDLSAYAGASGAQLLVDGDHALVILTNGGEYGEYDMPYYSAGQSDVRSTLLFVDLQGEPEIDGTMRIDGSYLDARQVGTTVRLVATSVPQIGFSTHTALKSTNQDLVEKAPIDAWLPKYTVTSGGHTTSGTVPCDRVSHPTSYTGASMITVYTLNLDDLGADPEPVSIAADGDTVYANASSLYVATNPYWYCCRSTTQQTQLHRFDIAGDGPPTYLGSATVPGRLLNQYSLSEYDDHLRVATESGSSSSVYVLDAATLDTTGHVSGLGNGERLYAVRFAGPMAYVVTFRNTDPLYLVDLHDPDAPVLAGSLELTGYSNYLHDAGDGRVIGVGQDASSSGRVSGLQVSLFDVHDPSAPERTGHVVLDNTLDESDFDPHTFLYWAPTGLVVVPVPDWSGRQAGKVLVCTVDGTSLHEVGTLANPVGPGTTDDGLGIRRSMVVGDELWTISSSGIRAVDPKTLDTRAVIAFPTP